MSEHGADDTNRRIHSLVKVRQCESRQFGDAKKIDFKDSSQSLLSRIFERAHGADPRIVEDQIDPTQLSHCRVDQILSTVRICYIAWNRDQAAARVAERLPQFL